MRVFLKKKINYWCQVEEINFWNYFLKWGYFWKNMFVKMVREKYGKWKCEKYGKPAGNIWNMWDRNWEKETREREIWERGRKHMREKYGKGAGNTWERNTNAWERNKNAWEKYGKQANMGKTPERDTEHPWERYRTPVIEKQKHPWERNRNALERNMGNKPIWELGHKDSKHVREKYGKGKHVREKRKHLRE